METQPSFSFCFAPKIQYPTTIFHLRETRLRRSILSPRMRKKPLAPRVHTIKHENQHNIGNQCKQDYILGYPGCQRFFSRWRWQNLAAKHYAFWGFSSLASEKTSGIQGNLGIHFMFQTPTVQFMIRRYLLAETSSEIKNILHAEMQFPTLSSSFVAESVCMRRRRDSIWLCCRPIRHKLFINFLLVVQN